MDAGGIAGISVDAYPLFDFLSRNLGCHLVEVTGTGKFIISASM